MFVGWDNFYVVLGTSGGALIGIMALVATLTSGNDHSKALRGQRLYLTPTVFHMAAVLTLSAVELAHTAERAFHLLLMAALVLYGLGFAVVIAVQLARADRSSAPHWSDFWCYGFLPAAVYGLLAIALASTAAWPVQACYAFALGLLVLLLVAIRNAWDLVTWLAPRKPPV